MLRLLPERILAEIVAKAKQGREAVPGEQREETPPHSVPPPRAGDTGPAPPEESEGGREETAVEGAEEVGTEDHTSNKNPTGELPAVIVRMMIRKSRVVLLSARPCAGKKSLSLHFGPDGHHWRRGICAFGPCNLLLHYQRMLCSRGQQKRSIEIEAAAGSGERECCAAASQRRSGG